MNIHKAPWEQPAHQHPSRHGQSHTCVTQDPSSPATGGCVWQGGRRRHHPCTHRGTQRHIELLWHCQPLPAHPNPQPCRADQSFWFFFHRGAASNPSHSFWSCYHPHSQIFEYMCWNDLTIMALAKIWCCFDWMWFKLPSAGLYFSGPILKTMFPLTVTLIHMKIKQAE